MSFTSYAQNFEDVMLWRALKHVKNGFYVDIGAQDPVVDSVSRAFYEHGWQGVHIEATERYAQMIRHARPDEIVVQTAVGDQQGTISFYEIMNTGLSTAVAAIAQKYRRNGLCVREIRVPCTTLDQVLAAYLDREIHWMKIDVEGYERQVINGWTDKRIRPWVLTIESLVPGSFVPAHSLWEQSVLARGYFFVYFDGLNRFYCSVAHPELARAFDRPPNLFDEFALSGKASSPFPSVLNARIATLEEQLGAWRSAGKGGWESEELSRMQRERGELRRDLAESQRQLATQSGLLTKTRKLLDASNAEIALVYGSLSWRLTRPLRWANALLGSLPLPLRRYRERALMLLRLHPREIAEHARLWVVNRPRLATLGRWALAPFFRSRTRLKSGAWRSTVDASEPTPEIASCEKDVSTSAARFLNDMRRAFPRQ